jgi:Peptidase family M23
MAAIPTGATRPWYTYDRIDNFGLKDPQGNWWKPDVNVLAPYGYPITELLGGTVVNVGNYPGAQNIVTVKLDTPLNSMAKYEIYQHLSKTNVQVGQHVTGNTIIGYNNLSGADLGFSLASGDFWTSSTGWTDNQKDLAPGGAGFTNPGPILDQLALEAHYQPKVTGEWHTSGSPTLVGGNGGHPPLNDCGLDIGCYLSHFFAGIKDQLVSWGEHIALFIIALVLIIVGFVLMGEKHAIELASKVPVL